MKDYNRTYYKKRLFGPCIKVLFQTNELMMCHILNYAAHIRSRGYLHPKYLKTIFENGNSCLRLEKKSEKYFLQFTLVCHIILNLFLDTNKTVSCCCMQGPKIDK